MPPEGPPDDLSADERERRRALALTGLEDRPDPNLDRVTRLAARLLQVPAAVVSLVDGSRQIFPGASGLPEPLASTRTTPLEQALCPEVVRRGEVLRVDDLAADPQLVRHPADVELGVRAYLGAPLLDADGRVLGSLCALSQGPNRWSDDDVATLADLALGVSGDLRARIATTEAAEASAALALAERQLHVSLDASGALLSTLDPGEAVARLLEAIVPGLAVWAGVYLRADDEETADERGHISARHSDPARQPFADRFASITRRGPTRARLVDQVLAGHRRSVQLWPALDPQIGGELRATIEALGIGPGLLVPVATSAETIGALLLVAEADHGRFSAAEVDLAMDLGLRAGMAIEHGRSYRREQRIAVTLQRSLLPALPPTPGFEVAASYVPASASAEVGGDWYDVLPVPDGVRLSVGDVTGHSIAAAAVMGKLRGALHTLTAEGYRPDDVLRRLDAHAATLLDGLAASAVVGWLATGELGLRLHWSNAGHLPPVLAAPGAPAVLLERRADPLLGVLARPPRRLHEIAVAPGSLLVLCTDGLVEQPRRPLDEGLAHLLQEVGRIEPGTPLQEACADLVAAMAPHGTDDVAVLLVRAGAPG